MARILGIIPARFDSSRFPGKALADIAGKPMIQHVYERVSGAESLDKVIVATDSKKIVNCVEEFGGEVITTSVDHKSGTERCNEVVGQLDNA